MWFYLKASNFLFLLSQSERLQNRCQPGAAGNWCDQHHGFLCVSLPCHWQLREVCVSACLSVRARVQMFTAFNSVMFSPHIQDSGELPEWCLHSSWRDCHQWVLTPSLYHFCPLVVVSVIAHYPQYCHFYASLFNSFSSEKCCHRGQR